jgi:hypothetical protein
MRRLFIAILAITVACPLLAWNATGHQAVAAVAWDNMTEKAQNRAIDILMKAPDNACLLDMFSHDTRPLKVRQREFFIRAATWPDVIRPNKDKVTGAPDPRPCTQFHHADWHFYDHFWSGVSGATGANAPKNRPDVPEATTNAVERLEHLKPLVGCNTGHCQDAADVQAMDLAWILHLAGDIHQPLHNAGRVTTAPKEETGDQGGNLFLLDKDHPPSNLHSLWDGIVDSSIPRNQDEQPIAYIDRVSKRIEKDHPKSSITDLNAGDFKEWSEEGVVTAKAIAYPSTLHRNHAASAAYRQKVFAAADKAIAIGGYRLADLLNSMFD